MVPDLDVDITRTDSRAVARLVGELDLATAPRPREEFVDLVGRGVRTVTVDPAGVGFIDSTGLAVLVAGLKQLREHGGGLALQSPDPSALSALEMTGLTRIFAITEMGSVSPETALRADGRDRRARADGTVDRGPGGEA